MKIPRLLLIGGKLAIICVVAAVVLGLVNAVTAPVIVENRARALAEGLNSIAAGSGISGAAVQEAREIDPEASVRTAYPVAAAGETVAFVLQLVGDGYGGDMNMLAGYFPSGELFAARMMENQETPGLGKKAETAQYMEMFLGYGADTSIPVSKRDLPSNSADSITGATITFNGVARALAEGSDAAQSLAAGGAQ